MKPTNSMCWQVRLMERTAIQIVLTKKPLFFTWSQTDLHVKVRTAFYRKAFAEEGWPQESDTLIRIWLKLPGDLPIG